MLVGKSWKRTLDVSPPASRKRAHDTHFHPTQNKANINGEYTHLARGELRVGLGVGVGGVLQLGSHPRDFALRTALRLRYRLDTQYVVAMW